MKRFKHLVLWRILFKGFLLAVGIPLLVVIGAGLYVGGYYWGYSEGTNEMAKDYESFLSKFVSSKEEVVASPTPTSPPPAATNQPASVATQSSTWGGPELWEAVNNRRVELGVGKMETRSELCTIASIRLNELLARGSLDGHEGFSNLPERRPDLKWIFEKYTISEFLVSGAKTAQDVVSLWENTLGHKKLLTGGEYAFGCTYAAYGFGVAIAAYQ